MSGAHTSRYKGVNWSPPGKILGMSPNLNLGPLLRYAGVSDATVWVETDASCEVEVQE
jgi:hypothetical protein